MGLLLGINITGNLFKMLILRLHPSVFDSVSWVRCKNLYFSRHPMVIHMPAVQRGCALWHTSLTYIHFRLLRMLLFLFWLFYTFKGLCIINIIVELIWWHFIDCKTCQVEAAPYRLSSPRTYCTACDAADFQNVFTHLIEPEVQLWLKIAAIWDLQHTSSNSERQNGNIIWPPKRPVLASLH